MEREAQHEAAFVASMGPGRQLLEEEHVTKDVDAAAALIEQLGRPKPKSEPCQHARPGAGRTGTRTAARATASTGAEGHVQGLRHGLLRARAPEGHGARTATRATASTGARRARARTVARATASTGAGRAIYRQPPR
jgi:hypothetical protein